MPRQENHSQHTRSGRGRGDGQSPTTRRQQKTSIAGSLEIGTPQRFLRGDMGDHAAATHNDFFPDQEERQRTALEGAGSASQGSALQYQRGSPLSRRRLDKDFAAAT